MRHVLTSRGRKVRNIACGLVILAGFGIAGTFDLQEARADQPMYSKVQMQVPTYSKIDIATYKATLVKIRKQGNEPDSDAWLDLKDDVTGLIEEVPVEYWYGRGFPAEGMKVEIVFDAHAEDQLLYVKEVK